MALPMLNSGPQDPTKQPADGGQDVWKDAKSPKEDMLFQKVWQQMAGRAAQTGMTEEQAWAAYNKAGRPRGHDTTTFMQGVTAPANAAGNTPIAADQSSVNLVKQAAGLDEGGGADQVSTIDPVKQAINEFRGADVASSQQQQDAFTRAQSAGQEFRGGQQQLIAQLQEAARGGGPSAAMALFQLALGKNVQGIQGAAAGVRGGSAVAAARNAGLAGQDLMRESAGAATALRAQEQQSATQLLGQALESGRQGDLTHATAVSDIAAQIRGQDVGKATAMAGLVQAQQLLEQQKRQAATGTALSLLQTDLGVQGQNVQTELAKAGILTNYNLGNDQTQLGYDQLKFQKDQASQQMLMQLLGSALGAGGALGAASIGAPGGATAAARPSVTKLPPPSPYEPPPFRFSDVTGL